MEDEVKYLYGLMVVIVIGIGLMMRGAMDGVQAFGLGWTICAVVLLIDYWVGRIAKGQ